MNCPYRQCECFPRVYQGFLMQSPKGTAPLSRPLSLPLSDAAQWCQFPGATTYTFSLMLRLSLPKRAVAVDSLFSFHCLLCYIVFCDPLASNFSSLYHTTPSFVQSATLFLFHLFSFGCLQFSLYILLVFRDHFPTLIFLRLYSEYIGFRCWRYWLCLICNILLIRISSTDV